MWYWWAAWRWGWGWVFSSSLLRILFQTKLFVTFLVLYILVFFWGAFTAPDYMAVAFDSGGVTTGPITVPLILALGVGVSAVRGSKSAEEDSFGLCALCSIGPIMAILIVGMFFDSLGGGYLFETVRSVDGLRKLIPLYLNGMKVFAGEVTIALAPIALIFTGFQLVKLKLPLRQLIKIGVGIVYTLVGLTIFLMGVNIGFMPAGTNIGHALACCPTTGFWFPSAFCWAFLSSPPNRRCMS